MTWLVIFFSVFTISDTHILLWELSTKLSIHILADCRKGDQDVSSENIIEGKIAQ